VVNVIVEHPDNSDVLFLGTEHAAFASTDAGATWARMPNLPTTHYDDMVIHPREKDLVLGTHGRGIWILDDTRPFAEWSSASGPVTVFSAADGTIKVYRKDTSYRGQAEYAGQNPPDGVEVTYRLGSGGGNAILSVTNEAGKLVREMSVPAQPGTHRVNWDLRHSMPGEADVWTRHTDPDLARPIEDQGPWASPGRYTVTVSARGTSDSTQVEVRGDPEMPITLAMYEARERFMLDALALAEEMDAFMDERGISGGGFGRGGAPAGTPEARLRGASRTVEQVYGSLSGGGVRPGTLYPPTRAQIEAVAEARSIFEAVRSELGAG